MDIDELIEYIFQKSIEAKTILRGVVHKTPLDRSRTFSEMIDADVYLKLENLQKTGSFKVRGAFYKIKKLLEEKDVEGVIAASAGNHAQGVAYAAAVAGVKSKIVMPIFTPLAKVLATKSYGAEVILHGFSFDEAFKYAVSLSEKIGWDFIHPYDDIDIIAGQATIGIEIASELKDIDFVVVPIGGGGLISGISIAIKKLLGDEVKIIGVQSEAFPHVYEFLKNKKVVKEKYTYTLAEGIAVKKYGNLTSVIIRKLVDDVVLVSDEEIARAIFLLLERAKNLVEGAGAASLAALLSKKINVKNKKVVAIISGGNINMTVLMKIISRELMKFRRLVKIRGRIPDRPGALRDVLSFLAEENINVVDIVSERYDPAIPPSEAEIVLVIEVSDEQKVQRLLNRINTSGFRFEVEEFC